MATSSEKFNEENWDKLKSSFEAVANKINNYRTRELPSDPIEREQRINQYKTELITTYNEFIAYTGYFFDKFSQRTKEVATARSFSCKQKLLKQLATLGLTTDIPDNFDEINILSVHNLGEDIHDDSIPQIFVTTDQLRDLNGETSNQQRHSNENNANTTNEMDDFEFMTKAGQIIKKPFTGDVGALDAFIDAVELVESVTPADKVHVLLRVIKTKLEEKAKQLTKHATTIDEIKNILKSKIQPMTPDVVISKLLALRIDRTSLQTFQENVEKYSEHLRISYIAQGIPHDVAKKMTIEKTVEACQYSCKTQHVKTVLESTHFDEPNEVVAKFLVVANKEKRMSNEAQVLRFNSNNGQRGRNNNGQRHNNYRGNNYNSNNFRQNNNYRQNNNNNNNNGNNDQNYRNDRRNDNQRGRGNWRGRGGNRNNDRYVRAAHQENHVAPPSGAQNVQLNQAE